MGYDREREHTLARHSNFEKGGSPFHPVWSINVLFGSPLFSFFPSFFLSSCSFSFHLLRCSVYPRPISCEMARGAGPETFVRRRYRKEDQICPRVQHAFFPRVRQDNGHFRGEGSERTAQKLIVWLRKIIQINLRDHRGVRQWMMESSHSSFNYIYL